MTNLTDIVTSFILGASIIIVVGVLTGVLLAHIDRKCRDRECRQGMTSYRRRRTDRK